MISILLGNLYLEAVLLARHLGTFLRAVIVQWKVLMGGIIMLAIKLIEKGSGHEVPPRLYWSLTIVFIAAAVFNAWRDERRKWERLDSLSPLNLTLKELVAEYHDRTTIQADVITKRRVGKLYRTSWPIKDIAKKQVTLETPSDNPSVILYFTREWRRAIKAFQKKDHITVEGRIRRLGKDEVVLARCELVDETRDALKS